jgi:hypothetical protein
VSAIVEELMSYHVLNFEEERTVPAEDLKAACSHLIQHSDALKAKYFNILMREAARYVTAVSQARVSSTLPEHEGWAGGGPSSASHARCCSCVRGAMQVYARLRRPPALCASPRVDTRSECRLSVCAEVMPIQRARARSMRSVG